MTFERGLPPTIIPKMAFYYPPRHFAAPAHFP